MRRMATHSSIADDSPHWHKIVAGAVAGGGARFFTLLDLLRIRRQLYPTSNGEQHVCVSGASPVQRQVFRALFWRGNVAATYLWMGYSAIQFSIYDYSSHTLSETTVRRAPLPFCWERMLESAPHWRRIRSIYSRMAVCCKGTSPVHRPLGYRPRHV